MSAYCRVCFTIKAEKNISWFIVENKKDETKITYHKHFISEKLSFCFLDLGAFSSVASLSCLSY
jgi:hypothetical protein